MSKYVTKDKVIKQIVDFHLVEGKMSDAKKVKLLYALSNNIENNYKEIHIRKKNGDVRILYEPSPSLKSIQKRLLVNYLYELNTSMYVTSYTKGKSILDNAIVHTGKKKILKLDIESFFDNISFPLIYEQVFSTLPRNIGMLFTNLVCYYGMLPQGAPTSAYISNLVLRDFDIVVGGWASEHDIDYTRYSDDMTFSGNFDVGEVIRIVRSELKKYHLCLNEGKTRVIKNSRSQVVTGVCVNEKAQVPKSYRRSIRQTIYYIKKFGLDDYMKHMKINDKMHFLRSLHGKVLFVLSIDKENKEFLEYKKFLRGVIDEAK